MKKEMNYLMSLAVVAMAFVSCEDDNNDGGNSHIADGKITAIVENGASYATEIDSVYAEIFGNDEDNTLVLKSKYINGGFTLTLPTTLSDDYLYSFETVPPGIKVSDNSVKTNSFSITQAFKDGRQVGNFERSNIHFDSIDDSSLEKLIQSYAGGIYTVTYYYVDKPLVISGSYVDEISSEESGIKVTEIYENLSLQKGWNVAYRKTTITIDLATHTVSTTKSFSNSEPAGLKWFYYSWQ